MMPAVVVLLQHYTHCPHRRVTFPLRRFGRRARVCLDCRATLPVEAGETR